MTVTIIKTGPFAFDGTTVRNVIEGDLHDDLPAHHEDQLIEAGWAKAKGQKAASPVTENKMADPVKENKAGK